MTTKILMSIMMLVMVCALVVGGALAWFGDHDVVVSDADQLDINAGTVDIQVDGPDPWNGEVTVDFPDDWKPCYTGWIDFDITNIGQNPAVIWKHVDILNRSGGEPFWTDPTGRTWSSEPEWDAAVNDQRCSDNLAEVVNYDMTLTPERGCQSPCNDQVMFLDEDDVTLEDIDSMWIPIGTLEPGERMHVRQSYHIRGEAGNEYQGDTLDMTIDLYAEQRLGPGPVSNGSDPQGTGQCKLMLDNKTCWDNWDFLPDRTWALLRYNSSCNTFDYDLDANGLIAGETYDLVWWDDPSTTKTTLGTHVADASGQIHTNGSANPGTMTNAKIWLVPQNHGNDDTLWESHLIDYVKCV